MQEISEIIIPNSYLQAHLSDDQGYSPTTHNYSQEDVILHMYEILNLFRKAFTLLGWEKTDFETKKILEVGCAWGFRLNQLLGFDFQPSHVYGIDTIPEFIERAKRLNPAMNMETMSAANMKFEDGTFDCSIAVMALSAMLDKKIIDETLAEMCRVSTQAVIIVDNFQPSCEERRNETLYFKGVDKSHLEKLGQRPDVAEIRLVGTFWSTHGINWKIYGALKRCKLDNIAYTVAIRLLARHSHRAYLVKLKDKKTLNTQGV